MWIKSVGWVANSVDTDQTTHLVASILGLHCLLRPVYSNTQGYYSKHGEELRHLHISGDYSTAQTLNICRS